MATGSPPPVVSARNLHIRRGYRKILDGLDFEVEGGSVIGLEAEAGQGATTLLKTCAGLLSPDEGTVEIDGIDIHRAPYARRREAKRRIGFVFQEEALIQNLSVFDNVALPIRYHSSLAEADLRGRVLEILSLLGLERHAGLLPADLGQQEAHAASLARAIGVDPEIIIFDDFFSRLSRERALEIWDRVRSRFGSGLTAVIGTTDRGRLPTKVSALHVLRDGKLLDGGGSTGGNGR